MVLALGMAVVGCDDGNGGGGGSDGQPTAITGTWRAITISYTTIQFSDGNFTVLSYGSSGVTGTFSGSTLTANGGVWGPYISGQGTATVVGDTLTISGFTGSGAGFINGTYVRE
ncbi:hypothetical protein AGMMS49944_10930 [Spirochaetia bacterium]|nr:hypothetical protein AGMMS49944_10930 [Spirochaetia bacterium]